MASPVRIGVIGVGFGARAHIPAYQLEGLEVVAVCASREERAKEAAERFGIPRSFTDYHEMLRMDGLDAVSVVGPRPLHYDMTNAVLEAGKHVICEKPFTTRLDEARKLWKKAEELGVTAMVAHEFRFSPARARVKELLDEGYVGKLHSVQVNLNMGGRGRFDVRLWSDKADNADDGGGLLWGQGSHYVDGLRHWFGEVAWVSGRVFTHVSERTVEGTREIVQASADDAFQMTLGFADGGWASMNASNVSPHGVGASIEIYGSKGTLSTPQPTPDSPNPAPHPKLYGARLEDEALAELDIPERLDPYDDEGHDGLMPMRWLAKAFVRGIEAGVSPAPSFYDGYRCQQVLHAVRESSSTGRIVMIAAEG
jgi:predicted dehydrogenase